MEGGGRGRGAVRRGSGRPRGLGARAAVIGGDGVPRCSRLRRRPPWTHAARFVQGAVHVEAVGDDLLETYRRLARSVAMFTGIVTDVGAVRAVVRDDLRSPGFRSRRAFDTAASRGGASIACSGVCLTHRDRPRRRRRLVCRRRFRRNPGLHHAGRLAGRARASTWSGRCGRRRTGRTYRLRPCGRRGAIVDKNAGRRIDPVRASRCPTTWRASSRPRDRWPWTACR